jgi:very-short-patch-repair endonuclease
VALPADSLWKRDYAASVRRLVRDGVDTPLPSLFVTVARPIPADVEGARRARSASEAFVYRRLETLSETRGRFQLNTDLPIPFDDFGRMEIDRLCADSRVVVELDGGQHLWIQMRTGTIDARINFFKRTAISCCVISLRTWPRNLTRCSTGFCDR